VIGETVMLMFVRLASTPGGSTGLETSKRPNLVLGRKRETTPMAERASSDLESVERRARTLPSAITGFPANAVLI